MKEVGSYWKDEKGWIYKVLEIKNQEHGLKKQIVKLEFDGGEDSYWTYPSTMGDFTPSTEDEYLLQSIN